MKYVQDMRVVVVVVVVVVVLSDIYK